MLTRLIDYLKLQEITAMFTSLTSTSHALEDSEVGVSSLMDTWILVRHIESNGERNRGIYILKARGMAHSNQVREFLLTDHGVELVDAYIGSDGVLMGSARSSQLAREAAVQIEREIDLKRKKQDLRRKQELYEAQLISLKGQYEAERDATLRELEEEERQKKILTDQRLEIARLRKADKTTLGSENGARKARKGAVR
jgi:circadian clock protein KaiC